MGLAQHRPHGPDGLGDVAVLPQHVVRLGSQVWRWCDGERTVEAVVDAFAAAHGLTFHEARVAVAGYVSSLVKRGALAIAMPKEKVK